MGSSPSNAPKKILIAVSGSISAYRAADVVSQLVQKGHEVQCLMTASAREFVTPTVLETLSRRPVHSELFGPGISGTEHIRLARWPDLVVFAPATAHLIAKLALGLADDLVTTVALATEAPSLIAPAMNTVMWKNPATRAHVASLQSRGAQFIDPDEGVLACGEMGPGKLAPVDGIVREIERQLQQLGRRERTSAATSKTLAGKKILITAGPTVSRIDAVRYMTNASTGKMGAALAEQALLRGAEVEYVLGVDKGVVCPTLPPGISPERLRITEVETAEQMADAALARLPGVDGVVATAAVLDYRVAEPADRKLKRATQPIELKLLPSTDVLSELRRHARDGQWFLGFAAETDELEKNARDKLERKNLDFLFANQVKAAFGTETNAGLFLSQGKPTREVTLAGKTEIAARIWELVVQELQERTENGT